jgi:hypothetical protein
MTKNNPEGTSKKHSLRSATLRAAADALGKLWALPCTLLGLSYGVLWYLCGKLLGANTTIRFGNNAIQFIGCGGIVSCTALTLGNVILYGNNAEPWRCGAYGDQCVTLGRHEQAHTYQYQVLGVLFLPAYLAVALQGIASNPFELAAQRFGAMRGTWWPW